MIFMEQRYISHGDYFAAIIFFRMSYWFFKIKIYFLGHTQSNTSSLFSYSPGDGDIVTKL